MRQNTEKNQPLVNRMKHFFFKLRENEDGGMMPLIAFMSITIVALMGLAIDGARAFYVKDILQRSVDAAGLAAGHAIDPDDSMNDAQEFFDANFEAAGGVATDGQMVIEFDPNNPNQVINISGVATLNTTFMQLFGFDDLTVDASAAITRETRGMELVLVMDNTGSMGFPIDNANPSAGTRIEALKPAATQLINIIYGDDGEDEVPNLFVGVVPFVATVNVGSDQANFLTTSGQQRIAQSDIADTVGWRGCVMARTGGFDQDDTPPNILPITPYVIEDTDPAYISGSTRSFENTDFRNNRNNWKGIRYFRPSFDAPLQTLSTSINEVDDPNILPRDPGIRSFDRFGRLRVDRFGQPIRTRQYLEQVSRGPNRGCSPLPITPLSTSRQKIIDQIDAMEPFSFGGTTTNFGLTWGWRVVSPNWRGLWNGGANPSELPLDYDEPFMDKVIVLLTDGENSISFDETSFGIDTDLANAPDTIAATAVDELDRRLAQTCNNIKTTSPTIIYTIALSEDVSAETRNLLQNCASNVNFFFFATNEESLNDAFDTIGQQLSNLRLSR